MFELVEDFGSFSVYKHTLTGKGVLVQNNYKGRKANAAVFDTVTDAINTALAVAFGGSIELTTRVTIPKESLSL